MVLISIGNILGDQSNHNSTPWQNKCRSCKSKSSSENSSRHEEELRAAMEEQRVQLEAEKERQVEELRQHLTAEKEKAIVETKKSQWVCTLRKFNSHFTQLPIGSFVSIDFVTLRYSKSKWSFWHGCTPPTVRELQWPSHVPLLLEHQLLWLPLPAWPLASTHVQVRAAKQVLTHNSGPGSYIWIWWWYWLLITNELIKY